MPRPRRPPHWRRQWAVGTARAEADGFKAMDGERQLRGQEFWWRATEPIPTRPEPFRLADEAAPEPLPPPPKPIPTLPRAAATAAPPQPPRATPSPETAPSLAHSRPVPIAAGRSAGRPQAMAPNGLSISQGNPDGARPARARRVRAGRPITPRRALMAASLAGALAFAGATGFGLRVRSAGPLPDQLDALLAKAGFAINEVSVSGYRRTLESEVFHALGRLDRSLLLLDVAAARGRIEALAWVETATIHRVLPGTLRIEITERQPIAVWHDGKRYSLIDASGRRLAQVGALAAPDLPRIAGQGAPEAVHGLIQALARHERLRGLVEIAHRIGDRRWDLELANGSRVRLPAGDIGPSLARLQALDQGRSLLASASQVIDLRTGTRIVVAPPGSATATAAARQSGPAARPSEPL